MRYNGTFKGEWAGSEIKLHNLPRPRKKHAVNVAAQLGFAFRPGRGSTARVGQYVLDGVDWSAKINSLR